MCVMTSSTDLVVPADSILEVPITVGRSILEGDVTLQGETSRGQRFHFKVITKAIHTTLRRDYCICQVHHINVPLAMSSQGMEVGIFMLLLDTWYHSGSSGGIG